MCALLSPTGDIIFPLPVPKRREDGEGKKYETYESEAEQSRREMA